MADGASLLDEELSSFVFNYLTESSGNQYGEEEVSSDRLDVDFSDIDLSQLDAGDFDSVSCLNELHWYNDQPDGSPASTHYSSGDPELFEIEEENAALLAALTDSLDEMVQDDVGGLGVFPSLGDGFEEEEEEEDLPQDSEPIQGSLSPETEDPSLLKKLLLSPPNVPEALREGALHHSNKSQHLKPLRQLAKGGSVRERKPHPMRQGRPCAELHRHLITAQQAETTPPANTEDDSESEDEDDESSSSGSDAESSSSLDPAESQFSSEKELCGVVELITYMHTYCLPSHKHAAGETNFSRRPRPQCPQGRLSLARPEPSVFRPREIRRHSLLRELLEAVKTFDVSKPYRLQSPPYLQSKTTTLDAGAGPKDSTLKGSGALEISAGQRFSPVDASFSVRRSSRLASFPSRFGKKGRAEPGRSKTESSSGRCCEVGPAKLRYTKLPAKETPCKVPGMTDSHSPCSQNEKRSQLCLPLAPKPSGDLQFSNKPFEQNLSVELCGTAGLTPPTTPPHKSVEDEPFRPEGRADGPPRGSWLSRTHPRKILEQTELYAQLRGMVQPSTDTQARGRASRTFGDHDYCLQGLAGIRKGRAEEKARKDSGRRGQPCDRQLWSKGPVNSKAPDCRTGLEIQEEESALDTEDGLDWPSPDHGSPDRLSFSCRDLEVGHGDEQRSQAFDDCQVFYIHNLPCGVTQAMLCKRLGALGEPKDCKIIIKDEERCGVVTVSQPPSGSIERHKWELPLRSGSPRRFNRKRYIDLDEAGPGPVKSKYDALDFDSLLKEAQKSLHH